MDFFKINRAIDVEIIGRHEHPVRSKIEDLDHGLVRISSLMEKGIPLLVRPGDKLRISGAINDGCYQFEACVTAIKDDNVPLIEFERPNSIKRIQRRRMFRLSVLLPVKYRHMQDEEWMTAKSADISGSGIRIVVDEDRGSTDNYLEMIIDLDGITLQLDGQIVAAGVAGTNQKRWYGIRFLDINRNEQDSIVRFIFERQRQMRRRGVI